MSLTINNPIIAVIDLKATLSSFQNLGGPLSKQAALDCWNAEENNKGLTLTMDHVNAFDGIKDASYDVRARFCGEIVEAALSAK